MTLPPKMLKVIRSILFASALAFIIGGPTWVQLLGHTFGPSTRSWRMFRVSGLKTCEVTYDRYHDDGTVERLDRFAILKVDTPNRHKYYRMRKKDDMRNHGRQLCRVLKGSDIRVSARCPSTKGWHVRLKGTINICQ